MTDLLVMQRAIEESVFGQATSSTTRKALRPPHATRHHLERPLESQDIRHLLQ